MKYLVLVVFVCLLLTSFRGHERSSTAPLAMHVVNYDTSLRKINDIWLRHQKRFTGYRIEVEKSNQLVYRLPIVNGKENGLAIGWYREGEKLMERHYVDGKKEGVFKQWWPNGNLRYLFHYKDDQFDGSQLIFFPDGRKREESNYALGRKDGRQQTWNEEGVLISNYVIKNNKLYGVIASKSCIPVFH